MGYSLLFLKKTGNEGVPYQSLHCQGAHWEIPYIAKPIGTEKLPLKDTIKRLLQESLEAKRNERKRFEETVEKVMKE